MKRLVSLFLFVLLVVGISACGQIGQKEEDSDIQNTDGGVEDINTSAATEKSEVGTVNIPEGFVLIEGGTFQMGSPETEGWRSDDETQHTDRKSVV